MPNAKSYNYDPPTREFAISTLIRSLGREKAIKIWNEACDRSNISGKATDIEQLKLIFDEISKSRGAAGVVGKSLKVRANTFITLNS